MANETREQLLKIADLRLHPSLTNPNYLVLRGRRRLLEKWLRQIPGRDWVVLDVGARYQPYRPLIQHRTKRYVAFDKLPTDPTSLNRQWSERRLRDGEKVGSYLLLSSNLCISRNPAEGRMRR
jgi:hypothetical protein